MGSWIVHTPCLAKHTPETPHLLISPKKHSYPLTLSAFLNLALPFMLGNPRTFAAAFSPSLLSDDSLPTRFFTQFSSCVKGNHPWKMFWPAVIAASHMLPISMTPEPCVRWNKPLKDTHTHTQTFIFTRTNNRIPGLLFGNSNKSFSNYIRKNIIAPNFGKYFLTYRIVMNN